jgi:D-alanyl-D-alanine carboxypeptidase
MQKNADQKRIIASVTKLMSAVVAKEHISQSQTITLTPQMLTPEGYSPALFAGLIISRDNLLKASLVQSTNDAAESLTYFLGKETFLSLMSQKTKELGMEHTLFYDAHGLSPQNTSTASDLAKLVAYIHKQHPEILAMTKENNFQLPGSAGTLFTFQNLNSFSAYPEFVGGKVGWLPEAQQTFASVFQVNGKPVTVIVLGSKDRKALKPERLFNVPFPRNVKGRPLKGRPSSLKLPIFFPRFQ